MILRTERGQGAIMTVKKIKPDNTQKESYWDWADREAQEHDDKHLATEKGQREEKEYFERIEEYHRAINRPARGKELS